MILWRLGSKKQKYSKQTRNLDDFLMETWIKEAEAQQTNKDFVIFQDLYQRSRSTTTKIKGILMIFWRLGSKKQKQTTKIKGILMIFGEMDQRSRITTNKLTRNIDDFLETWIKEAEAQQTNKEF